MSPKRVVVTGVGAISALGPDVSRFWDSLALGRSAIGPIESVDRSTLRFENGAEVNGFEPQSHFERRQLAQLDRFCQFALVAAREAVAASGIGWTDESRLRSGVVTGSSVGG
ncbi:MAG: beta-ketoacyl synthase N-terminal-like domain-containing protein, partial [Rhodothermales bacterium]|nr:beta-ketoacyl synthase N-terminal-like domain-containing protein [Rhodothermales bacterium]